MSRFRPLTLLFTAWLLFGCTSPEVRQQQEIARNQQLDLRIHTMFEAAMTMARLDALSATAGRVRPSTPRSNRRSTDIKMLEYDYSGVYLSNLKGIVQNGNRERPWIEHALAACSKNQPGAKLVTEVMARHIAAAFSGYPYTRTAVLQDFQTLKYLNRE